MTEGLSDNVTEKRGRKEGRGFKSTARSTEGPGDADIQVSLSCDAQLNGQGAKGHSFQPSSGMEGTPWEDWLLL